MKDFSRLFDSLFAIFLYMEEDIVSEYWQTFGALKDI